MKFQSIRDLFLAVLGGAAVPYVMVAALASLHAAFRAPADRIYAFMAPATARIHRFDPATMTLDALVGGVIGLLLSLVIARVTQTRSWLMWLVFVAAIPLPLLAHAVLYGTPMRLVFILRQPATLFMLGGASIGFWLGSRQSARRAAR